MATPLVSMRDITRRCGAVVANREVSLDLFPGEVHAIVGENGAGKTTLMKVLYGQRPPHSGSIEFEGRAVRIPSPAEAMKLGIGMVHQHFLLLDTLTVADNVLLGIEPRGRFGAYDPAAAERRVAYIAKLYQRVAGVKPADFVTASKSFGVDLKIKQAEAQIKAMQIMSTPTLVVAGKYRINNEAFRNVDEIIEVVNYLVGLESAKGAAAPAAPKKP